jgi:hypothetical protein
VQYFTALVQIFVPKSAIFRVLERSAAICAKLHSSFKVETIWRTLPISRCASLNCFVSRNLMKHMEIGNVVCMSVRNVWEGHWIIQTNCFSFDLSVLTAAAKLFRLVVHSCEISWHNWPGVVWEPWAEKFQISMAWPNNSLACGWDSLNRHLDVFHRVFCVGRRAQLLRRHDQNHTGKQLLTCCCEKTLESFNNSHQTIALKN